MATENKKISILLTLFLLPTIGFIIMMLALRFLPSPYPIIFVILFVLIMIYVSIKGVKMMGGLFKPQDIPNGIISPAQIINVQQSNMNMSMGTTQYYQMLIDVMVEGKDGSKWPARIKQMIPLAQLSSFAIGNNILIKYDPLNREKVILQNKSSFEIAAETLPPEVTQRLQAIEARYNQLMASGTSATATILKRDIIASGVMGQLDLVYLTIKVISPNIPPYQATIDANISSPSLFKTDIGKTIFIRYDANNPQVVALTGLDKENSAEKVY